MIDVVVEMMMLVLDHWLVDDGRSVVMWDRRAYYT